MKNNKFHWWRNIHRWETQKNYLLNKWKLEKKTWLKNKLTRNWYFLTPEIIHKISLQEFLVVLLAFVFLFQLGAFWFLLDLLFGWSHFHLESYGGLLLAVRKERIQKCSVKLSNALVKLKVLCYLFMDGQITKSSGMSRPSSSKINIIVLLLIYLIVGKISKDCLHLVTI